MRILAFLALAISACATHRGDYSGLALAADPPPVQLTIEESPPPDLWCTFMCGEYIGEQQVIWFPDVLRQGTEVSIAPNKVFGCSTSHPGGRGQGTFSVSQPKCPGCAPRTSLECEVGEPPIELPTCVFACEDWVSDPITPGRDVMWKLDAPDDTCEVVSGSGVIRPMDYGWRMTCEYPPPSE